LIGSKNCDIEALGVITNVMCVELIIGIIITNIRVLDFVRSTVNLTEFKKKGACGTDQSTVDSI
jgi:hypothetical protein